MKYGKCIIILVLAVFLLSMSSVCASEIDDTIASDDINDIGLSADDEIEDNLQTNDENSELTLTDTDVLGADSATYSDLAAEIAQSGNIKLKHKNYTYDTGATAITITEENKVIDGDGAVIDMKGSTIHAFDVTASGVTIKNLTIKNANYGDGGAVNFRNSGTVINCNFTNNTAEYSGGAVYFFNQGTVINCNFTNNTADTGGAVNFRDSGTVINCNFTNNTAEHSGGVLNIWVNGNVTNCNFINNTASGDGGAVHFYNQGTVINCNFVNNTASEYGGAVCFDRDKSTVSNSNFADNHASRNGGAVYFKYVKGNVTNCNFINNTAKDYGGAIYSFQEYTTADTCIFKRNSPNNLNTVIYPPTLNIDNFTTFYGSGEKLTFDLKTNSGIPVTNGNISIRVYFKDNGKWVGNYRCLSGEGWIPDLPVGSYIAVFDTEYADFKQINRTITITNATIRISKTPTNITVENETIELLVEGSIATGATLTPADAGNVTYTISNSSVVQIKDGIITAVGEGTAIITVSFPGNEDYAEAENKTIKVNVIITVNKATSIAAADVSTTYNINKDLVITLKDSDGNPLTGASVTVDLNCAKTYTTDKNGQIKVSTKGLKPKKYTAKITFNGNTNYAKSTKDVKVTVKKATPKLTAKKKTFKRSLKVKKYTIVLKNNVGKVIKKAKVTIKIGKKTFKAKTNSKGKATFKIKKVTKKRTYKAKVTFKGSAYYNKVTKKVKIRLR